MGVTSPKYRDYFITINEGAECWDTFIEEVKSKLNCAIYSYILHDKDMLNENGVLTPKKKHYHLIIELKNPITFKSAQNHFKGAHIESIKYKKSAYQYLIHNSPNSKEKYQYSLEEIITSSPESVKNAIQTNEGFELFNESMFLTYIAQGVRTQYQFVKRFGLNVCKQYWKTYSELLVLAEIDEEMKEDLERVRNELLDMLDTPF